MVYKNNYVIVMEQWVKYFLFQICYELLRMYKNFLIDFYLFS